MPLDVMYLKGFAILFACICFVKGDNSTENAVFASILNVTVQNLVEYTPKIIGGHEVTNRTRFAYQVSIRIDNYHFCGATIIDKETVVTAAHCCFNPTSGKQIPVSQYTLVVGDLYLRPPSETTVVKFVRKCVIHPEYIPGNVENDISILKIHGNFGNWTENVRNVPLADSPPNDNTYCIVSGWGSMKHLGPVSNTLQAATVPIVNFHVCKTQYHALREGMICAGYITGGKDACQGDSGGPLVCNGKLTGVVSWGIGCGRPRFPGVYTNVNYYLDWLKEATNKAYNIINGKRLYLVAVVLTLAIQRRY